MKVRVYILEGHDRTALSSWYTIAMSLDKKELINKLDRIREFSDYSYRIRYRTLDTSKPSIIKYM